MPRENSGRATPAAALSAPATAKLDDDSFYDMWTYRAQAGESVKITLRSSDFDAYLAVGRMDGDEFESDETDDDGAGGTDAEVKMTVPRKPGFITSGSIRSSAGEKGAYTLLLEEGPVTTPAVSHGHAVDWEAASAAA